MAFGNVTVLAPNLRQILPCLSASRIVTCPTRRTLIPIYVIALSAHSFVSGTELRNETELSCSFGPLLIFVVVFFLIWGTHWPLQLEIYRRELFGSGRSG